MNRLVRSILFFNRLFAVFDDVDTRDDRRQVFQDCNEDCCFKTPNLIRINLDEFKAGLSKMGLSLPDDEAEARFKSIDVNNGGQILFIEFSEWVIKKKIPVD